MKIRDERKKSEADQNPAKTARKSSIGWLVKSLGAWLDSQMDIRLAPLGLSKGQFAIIMTLLENEGVTQAEIGRKILMPGYATTRNIDKLELNELLERQHHKSSRRAHSIYLTAKGRKLAPALFAIVKDVNGVFLESIDDKDKKELNEILTILHDKLIVSL
jgi:DNA-binding MarR family transcriptional regulator